MGVVIGDLVKNVRRVHGFCLQCGYGFHWAIVQSIAIRATSIDEALLLSRRRKK